MRLVRLDDRAEIERLHKAALVPLVEVKLKDVLAK